MSELIERIILCVEKGKINKTSPYPKDMIGLEGADELTIEVIESGADPDTILQACNTGMQRIGERFGRNEVYVPDLLMAAKVMNAVMVHLKPFFKSGAVRKKGIFILGTVVGDLHDIGKNLVSMVIEGNGWEVVDLGVDVKPAKFLDKIREFPEGVVGLSALLTTTMANMSKTVQEIKSQFPNTKIIVGGAPLSQRAADQMGADAYAADPQEAVAYLQKLGI